VVPLRLTLSALSVAAGLWHGFDPFGETATTRAVSAAAAAVEAAFTVTVFVPSQGFTCESLDVVTRGIPTPLAPVPVTTFVPPNWVTFVLALDGGVVVTVPETGTVVPTCVPPTRSTLTFCSPANARMVTSSNTRHKGVFIKLALRDTALLHRSRKVGAPGFSRVSTFHPNRALQVAEKVLVCKYVYQGTSLLVP